MTVVDFDDTIFAGDEEDVTNHFENEIYFEPRIEEMGVSSATNAKDSREMKKPRAQNKKKMPEKNQNFKDVEETGKWGSVSRREVICCVATATAIVVGVVIAIVMLVKDRNSSNVAPPPPQKTLDEVFLSDNKHYVALRTKVAESVMKDLLLPELPRTYSSFNDADKNSPVAQAIVWLLHDDPIKVKSDSDLIPRFVLAALYFSHQGSLWKDSTNWMTDQNVCEWKGIVCNDQGNIAEIDLSANGLSGRLPNVWGLLEDTSSVMLNENQIQGPITGEAFGRMSNLTSLLLQDNRLTGTIPISIRSNGKLEKLFLQNNALSGSWPDEFCPNCSGCNAPIQEFGINCDTMDCPCCVPERNCFV